MITSREAITGIGVLAIAAATLSHARHSAAAARTGKVAVSGGNATYVGTKNLVPQDFSPEDAAEAPRAAQTAVTFDRLVTARQLTSPLSLPVY